jgi:hypothetical protein
VTFERRKHLQRKRSVLVFAGSKERVATTCGREAVINGIALLSCDEPHVTGRGIGPAILRPVWER